MNPRSKIGFATAVVGAALSLAGMVLPGVASASNASNNSNNAAYWVDRGEHPGALCYKHAYESNEHGKVTNNKKAVTLNTFNQSWPGDHWELLVVNGGNGDTVIQHPAAGTAYYPPLNNGGQKPDISHWIV